MHILESAAEAQENVRECRYRKRSGLDETRKTLKAMRCVVLVEEERRRRKKETVLDSAVSVA